MPNSEMAILEGLAGALVRASSPDPEKLDEQITEHRMRKNARENLHEMLARVAGKSARTSPVMRHDDPKNKVSLPFAMSLSKAQEILAREQEAEEKQHWMNFPMPYKFEDGLVAVQAVLEQVYGASGEGITHYDFFGGEHPPEKLEVQVGIGDNGEKITKTVPYTEFYFGPIDAKIDFSTHDDGGVVGLFNLRIYTKVKYETDAEALNILVRDYLDEFSIYRGQILTFDPSGQNGFGLHQVDRKVDETIVYSGEVNRRLTNKVWKKITEADKLLAAKKRTDFRVILWGPLGTGKSAGMVSTAVLARANGRTVIEYRPTEKATIKELQKVMAVARIYGPSVVLVEDFDRFFVNYNEDNRSMMTNLLDGVDKSDSVSLLMTTNYLDKIDPSVLRTPRTTGLVEIKHLDREGIETLLHLTLGNKLAEDVDFDRIWEVIGNYSPSFIRTAFDEAEAISIQNGLEGKIDTDALVDAAMELHDQHETYQRLTEEKEGARPDYLRLGIKDLLGHEMFQGAFDEAVAGLFNPGTRVLSDRGAQAHARATA